MKIAILILSLFLSSCGYGDLTISCGHAVSKEFNTTEVFALPNTYNYYIVKSDDGSVWYAHTSIPAGSANCEVDSKMQIFKASVPFTPSIPKTKLVPMT